MCGTCPVSWRLLIEHFLCKQAVLEFPCFNAIGFLVILNDRCGRPRSRSPLPRTYH